RQRRPERAPSSPLRRSPGGAPAAAPLRPRAGQRGARGDPPRDAGAGPAAASRGGGDPFGNSQRTGKPGAGPSGGPGVRRAGPPGVWGLGGVPDGPSMITLLVDAAAFDAPEVRIDGEPYRQLFRARRVEEGEELHIPDGKGRARWGRVARVDRTSATV